MPIVPPAHGVTTFIPLLNALIIIIRVIVVPVAIVYVIVLLRRIARNTEQRQ